MKAIQKKIRTNNADLKEISKAFKYAKLIKANKIRTRPFEELLKELRVDIK